MKHHFIRICSESDDSIDLNFYVPKGLSDEQLVTVKTEFTQLMTAYYDKHNNFDGFDSYNNLITTMMNLNIQWECVRVDKTILV